MKDLWMADADLGEPEPKKQKMWTFTEIAPAQAVYYADFLFPVLLFCYYIYL